MASWPSTSSRQYNTYLSRWEKFCRARNINAFNPSVETGIEFLTSLFSSGLGYSAINTARSALSSVITLTNGTFGNQPLVVRFMKGIYEMKPSLPRYTLTWDVGVVLKYLEGMADTDLSLKQLTLKLTTLLCLLTGQRCQTLSKLDISYMQKLSDRYIFTINTNIKTSKPGRHIAPIEILDYSVDRRLCVVSLITLYLDKTSEIRKPEDTQLLISYARPYKPVTSATIGKWVKSVMAESGIDTKTFKAHSGRSASTSYGKTGGLPLKDIMQAAGWSNATTFAKYYDKPTARGNLGATILNQYEKNKA